MVTAYEQKIIEYYENCDVDYRIVWHLNSKLAMHYGYWEKGISRLRDALDLMNTRVAEFADIGKNDLVLDAGCGVGGSSIFLAKNIGCRVKGITLSPKQAQEAKINAANNKVADLTGFDVRNYCSTGFADNTFDVVWGIESVCYATEKLDFLKEAYRILKPGGRVVVADFFRKELPAGSDELKAMKLMANSWAIEDFEVDELFEAKMKTAGFTHVKRNDVSENVYPSIRRLYYCYYPGIVCDAVLRAFGYRKEIHRSNMRSTLYQYKAYKRGLWRYDFFYGRKPIE